MNSEPLPKNSQTDWQRLDAMNDGDIDLSDCPEATPEMFANAVVRTGLSADTQSDKSLQQVMDEIGEKAETQGLTPEILEALLRDE
ncbi:MAG: hypothetical protein AAFR12_22825 [Cyanobacteria bacterium J06626_6]